MEWLAANWLVLILVLCCGVMMIFMHGGQNKGSQNDIHKH